MRESQTEAVWARRWGAESARCSVEAWVKMRDLQLAMVKEGVWEAGSGDGSVYL